MYGIVVKRAIGRSLRYVSDASFRHRRAELARLRRLPRRVAGTTDLLRPSFRFADAASFVSAYQQIIENRVYEFVAKRSRPRIIDCGANVGVATFYFKELYPRSHIISFEPDSVLFSMLESNCKARQLDGVELHCKAVGSRSGEVAFIRTGTDTGRVAEDETAASAVVEMVRLRDLLEEPVDFLKIDIEGSETDALIDCGSALANVDHLFVEYHSFAGEGQKLPDLLRVLEHTGFRMYLQPELVPARPFTQRVIEEGMDHRINIYCFRPLPKT